MIQHQMIHLTLDSIVRSSPWTPLPPLVNMQSSLDDKSNYRRICILDCIDTLDVVHKPNLPEFALNQQFLRFY